MNSTELLNEIKNQLELLKHKGYDKNSFKSGYLLGYAKALQLRENAVSRSTSNRFYEAYFFPKQFIKKGILKSGTERFKSRFRLCAKRDDGGMFVTQERITEYITEDFGANEVLLRKFKGKFYTKVIFSTALDTYFEQDEFLMKYLRELEQFTS